MKPMRPTPIGNLLLSVAAVWLFSYVLIDRFYGDLPRLPGIAAPVIFLLAAFEAVSARITRARIARRPDTRPVQPLVVARLVVLAKASAIGGGILLGIWGGAFTYTLLARGRLVAAGRDVLPAGLATGAALLLVLAALWLEYACRTPKPPGPPGGLEDAEDDLPLPT